MVQHCGKFSVHREHTYAGIDGTEPTELVVFSCPGTDRHGVHPEKETELPKLDLSTLDMVRHDEYTLRKVLNALARVVSQELAMNCITEMQNAGILFRERL